MRKFNLPRTKQKFFESRQEGWIKGVNKLVSNTQIKDTEIADSIDIQLVEDGKIQCPRDGQAYYGTSSGSRVTGLYPYYKSDGTKTLLRTAGTNLQKYVGTTPTNVTGGTGYTTGLNTNGIVAYDKLYLCNGTDNLTYYDGTQVQSFTQRTAPTISSVTRTGGGAGTFTYSYKVTTVTANGETTPSAAMSQTQNVAELTASIYLTVTWSAVTGAIGYNIYGNKDGHWYFMAYVEGNGTVTYVDNGSDIPNEFFTTPEGNSTGGQKGKYIALYKDSLFILGDTANPSRLYYSGGGDKLEDFTVGGGGGFIDVSKNDGQAGTGMIVFKDSLLVFKERSIYQFTFTSAGLPSVTQVNPGVGCVAPRSIVAVENDVFFASEFGVYTVGNEAGFSFDVLRTNELSAKVRSIYQTIDPAYIQNMSAVYGKVANKNLVIFSYTPSGSTTNEKALVYDRERLAWYPWSNIKANCFTVFKGTDGVNHVLYGCDSSGYVKEALTGYDDFGSAIAADFTLKSVSFGETNTYKKLKRIDLLLRQPQGSITLDIIKDGVTTAKTIALSTIQPSINFSHYVFTRFLFGVSVGTGVSTQDENLLRSIKQLSDVGDGRSFALKFSNNTTGKFTLLLSYLKAKPRSANFRHSEDWVAS
jgi:hypothetical protein